MDFFSMQRQYTTLWFYTTYCPLTVDTWLLHSRMISFGKSDVCSKQLLTNLEDEIFLKGGSVVTPQNFDLVLLIKIFARKLNFSICQDLPLYYFGFFPLVEKNPSKSIVGLICPLYKTILSQWV